MTDVKADIDRYNYLLERFNKEGPFLFTQYVQPKDSGVQEIVLWIDKGYLDLAKKGLDFEAQKANTPKLNIPPLSVSNPSK